jgi:hypothetical protein
MPVQGEKIMSNIRALFFKDGDLWVGQCLEFDIGAQARDLDTARSRLRMAIEIERKTSIEINGAPFKGIDPAPAYFHDMWEKRSREFGAESSLLKNGDSVTVDYALCA